MKKLFLLLALIFILPSVVFAQGFNYTTDDATLTAQTSAKNAVITVSSKEFFAVNQGPLGSTEREPVAGVRVWSTSDLSGTPVFESVKTASELLVNPPTIDTYIISGLTPNKTYYFKYYLGKKTIPATIAVTASPKTYEIKTETSDSHIILIKKSTGATIEGEVATPDQALGAYEVTVRTDDQGGVLGQTINKQGVGFVKTIPVQKLLTGAQATPFTITELSPETTYYLSLTKKNTGNEPVLATADTQTTKEIQIYANDLEFIKKSGTYYVVKGHIDTLKHPTEFQNFIIQFQTSRGTSAFPTDPGQSLPDAKPYNPYQSEEIIQTSVSGIADNGDYYFHLTTLDKHATYFFRQIITAPNGAPSVVTGKFNTDRGFVAPGSTEEASDFENRSYRLLAPLPGLSVLLDPDLCMEKQAEGGKGEICDINDFLNFVFRVMIGLSAVLLVLRIIFEGYQYAVSDVPFLKANAKQKIFEGFFGLLLALSAYLILNTVNPKLVQNDISIQNIDLQVEEYATIDPQTYKQITGQVVKAPAEYVKIVDTIAAQEGIDACIVKATIAIESTWRPNIIGCDENVRSKIPSRNSFIESGVRLDGSTFSERSVTEKVFNICPKEIKKDTLGYGLDWRFSKGGGLMQVTKFPAEYANPSYKADWNKRNTPFSGFEAIIIPEENIKAGISILKDALKQCNNNTEGAFRVYQAGPKNGCAYHSSLVDETVSKKMTQYNLCKANPTTYGLSGSQTSSTATSGKTLLTVGDSITAGFGSLKAYPKLFAEKNTDWNVDTSLAKGGMPTIWMETNLKTITSRYTVITIMGGTNDVSSGFPISQITSRLDRMIKKAKTLSDKVVVISPPVMLKNIYPAHTTQQKINDSLQTIHEFLNTYPGVEYVDFYTTTKVQPSLISSDGIHPTTAGQRKLLELVSEKVF